MKSNLRLKTYIIVLLSLVLVSCTTSKKEININNAAFIYGDETNQTLEVSMNGEYNTKEHSFNGSLVIGDEIKLEHVTFSPGSGLISYNESTRSYLGQIFFDYQSLHFSIEITDQDLYQQLTQSYHDGDKKITITSPANNMEDAKRINAELKDKKLSFEN
ncbi:hypothetical protein [Paenibacillus bouchesdurhonensis]|uniref:hypothetical protein n=1 Tax=Paenibacillus bouchesdurhonensis TaxID=1870990 RepID=UPI000DA61EDB|nr:hypothetical protein [Paenibacillus bouchesdurhonensis]